MKFNKSKIFSFLTSILSFIFLLLVLCLVLIFWIDEPLAWWIQREGQFAFLFFEIYTNSLDNLLFGNLIYMSYQKMVGLQYLSFASVRYLLLIALFVVFYIGLRNKETARVFIFIILVHLATTASAGILKIIIKRERPSELYKSSQYDLNFWEGQGDSFPSGHTADYFGFFLPLALGFQRFKWLILPIPILIALGRLFLHAHYLSDVFFSIGLAWVFCLIFGNSLRIKAIHN
jgi:membrane-associated phospholipid phosphatase